MDTFTIGAGKCGSDTVRVSELFSTPEEGCVPGEGESVLDGFSPSSVNEKLLFRSGRQKQVWRCGVGDSVVFVVEAFVDGHSNPSYELDPSQGDAVPGAFFTRESCDGLSRSVRSEFSERELGYAVSRVLGVPMPRHVFGDGWLAAVGGPEQSIQHVAGELRRSDTPEFDTDRFLTEVAKLAVFGHWDITPSNVLYRESNEYCFIDVSAKELRYEEVFRWYRKVCKYCSLFGIDSEEAFRVGYRAYCIACLFMRHAESVVDNAELRSRMQELVRANVERFPVSPVVNCESVPDDIWETAWEPVR